MARAAAAKAGYAILGRKTVGFARRVEAVLTRPVHFPVLRVVWAVLMLPIRIPVAIARAYGTVCAAIEAGSKAWRL